jgi:hypothetical protein
MKIYSAFLLITSSIVFSSAVNAQSASKSKGQIIYPDLPGFSQTCVVPIDQDTVRYKLASGSELMLVSATSEAQCQVFVVSKKRISVVGRPDLCVNIAASARRGVLYLEQCKDVSVASWNITASSTQSSRIRSLGEPFDNMCWTIPNSSNEEAKFPLRVQPAVCQKNMANEIKFFVE